MTTPITKEQAEAVFDLRAGYHLGNTDIDILRKLAENALAATGAEPVYQWRERYEEGSLWEDCTKEQYDGFAKNPECETRVLYTAPPAPVVNAEPVADVVASHKEGEERTCDIRWRRFDVAPGPLFAVAQPVAVVPDEMAISDDMNLYQKSFAQGHNACRAAMLNHSENERDMVERVSQACKLPSQSSDAVNEAAWKLHDTLTEHGPLNGHQFNNLKGCFYEALKVAMCNSPAIPDALIAVSERMPEIHTPVWCFGSIPEVSGKEFGFEGWLTMGGFVAENNSSSPGGCEKAIVTYWMPLPAAPQQEGK